MKALYNIDDLVLYGTHGICKITDITEKDYSNEMKLYYELRPLNDLKLQINLPVDSPSLQMYDLVNKEEALNILKSFNDVETITFDKNFFTSNSYNTVIKEANRSKVVSIISNILKRKYSLMKDGKKLPLQESKALQQLQGIFYNELAIALGKTYDEIADKIEENTAISI